MSEIEPGGEFAGGETAERHATNESAGDLAEIQQRRGDVAGSPAWPIVSEEASQMEAPPPVGLNWSGVSQRLGIDRRVLEHDGAIVLRGEYFPEAGYIIDPATERARFVDVGEIALRHSLFLGQLAMGDVGAHVPIAQEPGELTNPIIHPPPTGPIIGLFVTSIAAERARDHILQGSLGSGVTIQQGPLGVELRVERPELGGRVATVIASHAGLVLSVSGEPVGAAASSSEASATGPSMVGEQADAPRPGTGAASDSQRPARQWGGSQPADKS